MPVVIPALVSKGPSSTKIRSSRTVASGANALSVSMRLWWVVHWRPDSSPARANSRAAEQTLAKRVSGLATRASQSITACASGRA